MQSTSNAELSGLNNALSSTPTTSNHPSTPSGKRKKASVNRNTCRKCLTVHDSETDNKYNSMWINCSQRRCDYWIHAFCLGIVVEETNEEEFAKLFYFFCPSHNPKQLPRPKARKL